MKQGSAVERLKNGIITENPTFVLTLGMCPTLAVTTSAVNGLGMGLSTTVVLICSNLLISLFRKVIPNGVRMPAYIVIVASLVTVVQFLMQAYLPSLSAALGVYIPLIVVNCIILGRAEMFANKNGVLDSALDGIGMGLGFTLSLTCIGAVREIIGNGTIFSGFFLGGEDLVAKITIAIPFISEHPMLIIALAPGGFFVYACAIAVVNKILASKGKKPRDFGCQGCALASMCSQEKCLEELDGLKIETKGVEA